MTANFNSFALGDEVILVSCVLRIPVEEKAVIKSVEETCYVVQRDKGVMTVNLDGSIPCWGKGSHMKKYTQ